MSAAVEIGETLSQIQSLYDQHRYLDAYQLIRHLPQSRETVSRLSANEAVLAGRLVARLGGRTASKWLFRHAAKREPEAPLVRLYARPPRRHQLLDQLSDLERLPANLAPEVKATWLAAHARLLAEVRDFGPAHALVERARSIGTGSEWVTLCAAEVLLAEERFEEALAELEPAWKALPGLPEMASALGRALARLGRWDEAAKRLTAAADAGQSYELALLAIDSTCAWAERCEESTRRRAAVRAYLLGERLSLLAPFADRTTLSRIACARADAAQLAGEPELALEQLSRISCPYHRKMVENIRSAPAGRRLVLAHQRVAETRNNGLPASAAAVASVFGVVVDVAAMVDELAGREPALWQVEDWLREQGLRSRPFVASPDLARRLIRSGLPFVLVVETEDSSPGMAAVGLDEATGELILHCPGRERWERLLVDRLGLGDAPFGPLALAVVPPQSEELLRLLPDSACEPLRAVLAFERMVATHGTDAGLEVVRLAERHWSGHPCTLWLRATVSSLRGETPAAVDLEQQLLERAPGCLRLRRQLVDDLERFGDTARLRESLAAGIDGRAWPGVRHGRPWSYPPPSLVAAHAELVGRTPGGLQTAERELLDALQHFPSNAELLHALGVLYTRTGRLAQSALPLRLAATLAGDDDRFARDACDAMQRLGQEADGLALLGRRASAAALWRPGAVTTLVDALLDYGQPEQAAATLQSALAQRGAIPALTAHACRFWTRLGHFEEAEAAIAALHNCEPRAVYLEQATACATARGQLGRARELCQEWVERAPDCMEARQRLLELVARCDGRASACALAEQWVREREQHGGLAELHRRQLVLESRAEEAVELLHAWLERNPRDGRAWQELGVQLMDAVEQRSGAALSQALAEAEQVVGVCRHVCPEAPLTLLLDARLAQAHGEYDRAIDLLTTALGVEPTLPGCHRRALQLAANDPLRQRQLIEELEHGLLTRTGERRAARELATALAERLGLRETEHAVARWRQAEPGDLELALAHVDLLLAPGQRRAAAQAAADLLERMTLRFPHRSEPRYLLARAYRTLARYDEESATLAELVRVRPLHSEARLDLARALVAGGATEQAVTLLEEGTRCDPECLELWLDLSSLLSNLGRTDEALEITERASSRLGSRFPLRELLLKRALDAGRPERVVTLAREAVAASPDSAESRFLLGEALRRGGLISDITEIERHYRDALKLEPRLFEAADALAVLLIQQRRFLEAREVMREQASDEDKAALAHTRMAWITRQEGGNERAVDEVVDVVRRWPSVLPAWEQLIDWLDTERALPQARAILRESPPVLASRPDLAARRLSLLEDAGTAPMKLDREWKRLLKEHPDNEALHLRRFDLLGKRGDWDQAAVALGAIERACPLSPALQARRVALEVHRRHGVTAIEAARRLWQLPGDAATAAEEAAWKTLVDGGLVTEAVEAVTALVASGRRPRLRSFTLALSHLGAPPAAGDDSPKTNSRERRQVVTRLLQLLDELESCSGDSSHHMAAVLARLDALGETSAVLEYWRSHRALCVDRVPVWLQMSSNLVSAGAAGLRELRSSMRDWRRRQGVEMWAVANYTLSLRKLPGHPEDLDELYATSRDALTRLPYDTTARYLACVLCETTLRCRGTEELLAAVERWEPLLARASENSRLWSSYRWAPAVIPLFADLARCADPLDVLRLTEQLTEHLDGTGPAWICKEWQRRAAPRLGATQRLRVRVLLHLPGVRRGRP